MSFDPTKPVRTRDGREVKILETDGPGEYPIFGRVKYADKWVPHSWYANGRWVGANDDPRDLVNIPREFSGEGWLNVFIGDSGPFVWRTFYRDRAEADEAANNIGAKRFACVKVTAPFREGDGL